MVIIVGIDECNFHALGLQTGIDANHHEQTHEAQTYCDGQLAHQQKVTLFRHSQSLLSCFRMATNIRKVAMLREIVQPIAVAAWDISHCTSMVNSTLLVYCWT